MDGWGFRTETESNAILSSNTPHWDKLWKTYPHTLLNASGLDVGLPAGQMGNSEVGHLTMGAGRVVYQDLTRISLAIETGDFFNNPILVSEFQTAKEHNKTIHVLGLLSPGGVHSHEDHIFAVIEEAKRLGVKKIIIHPFLDGRDTPPKSAARSLQKLEALCKTLEECEIGSISGRYYAMDRDKRYERTEKVYRLLTEGRAEYYASTAEEALEKAYLRGETDEFVSPTIIGSSIPSHSEPLIVDGDIVLFMNFRADRARQLSYAFTDPKFHGFHRNRWPKLGAFLTLTQYAEGIKAKVLFPTIELNNILGEFLQDHGLTQCRIAETEKYAHVTFFLNGGREEPFKGEERILIPSARVATYDLKPEMSALEITEELCKSILNRSFDVIVCNFANADMVGHTGDFNATIHAVEILDQCLGKVVAALEAVGGEALITADHGNAEIMYDNTTKQPHTAHTSEPVPLIYIGLRGKFHSLKDEKNDTGGGLADIAPTLIAMLGYSIPSQMTGRCLVNFNQ